MPGSPGGIGDGRGIAAAFSLGAEGVQMGTAFLRCPETKLSKPFSDALASCEDNSTCITYAFSGRPARGIKNEFIKAMLNEKAEIPDFPIPNQLTGKLKAISAKAGKAEYMSLWSGQSAALSTDLPASELIAQLVTDSEAAFKKKT